MTMALAKARKEEGGGVSKSSKSNTGGVLVLAGRNTSSRHFTKLVFPPYFSLLEGRLLSRESPTPTDFISIARVE